MRDYILLYINGKRYTIRDEEALLPLADLLRNRLGLTGAKVVCGEGACGACTVLVGKCLSPNAKTLHYRSTNSCLHRVFQLDCCHIVTVEGVGTTSDLSPVQEAIICHQGAQCGYCTPGVVLSLTALCETRSSDTSPDASEIREALSGNLCRCTGYLPILHSGQNISADAYRSLARRYPSGAMEEELTRLAADSVTIHRESGGAICHAATLSDALTLRSAYPAATIVDGGTMLSSAIASEQSLLSIGAVPEMATIVPSETSLYMGATVTWEALREATDTVFPELARLIDRFGSPQLRHWGTVGGSVVQADGNSDWLPLLLIQNAMIHSASLDGERQTPFSEFLSERRTPGELVTGITLPYPSLGERLALYKVARRRTFDRSVFCAAVALEVASSDNRIISARIACGGVGPRPVRLPETEAFLEEKEYTEATMRRAGEIAAREIAPVSDAYAGADYRRQLTAGLLLRYFFEQEETIP